MTNDHALQQIDGSLLGNGTSFILAKPILNALGDVQCNNFKTLSHKFAKYAHIISLAKSYQLFAENLYNLVH